MCLISCEFKGKAISLINGCKRSVWYVFVHVANFSVSLANGNQDWLKIRQSKKIFCCPLSGILFFGSQVFIFTFPSLCSLYSRVTNNRSSYKMGSMKAIWKKQSASLGYDRISRRDYNKGNDGGLFLLWKCLMKRATETGFPHHLFFLTTGNAVA